jgi:hypothetical protein
VVAPGKIVVGDDVVAADASIGVMLAPGTAANADPEARICQQLCYRKVS